jgi:dephospho-CoA kinase
LRRAVARGLPEDDVRRRMGNQVSREKRLAKADFVVDNSGPESALPAEVDRAWEWIQSLKSRSGDAQSP